MSTRYRLKGINQKGFSLIELLIVLLVVAILVALAYPSYTQYVRKAKRGEAQQMLMNWSVNQEIFRSNNPQYAANGDLAPPAHDDYSMNASDISATSYTLTADASGDQENDVEDGVSCDVLTLDENGVKGPIQCWGGNS